MRSQPRRYRGDRKLFSRRRRRQAPFPGQGPGLNGLKDVLRGVRAAFPDIHWLVEEQIEDDDKVVGRFVWSGTQQAEFLGVPATGCPVFVWSIAIDRIVDRKIKEARIIMDGLGLMAQIGALPVRAS
jgi:predicted ester cyclase